MHGRSNIARQADVVIAGAGIAGVSTAFHLAAGFGVGRVVLCDPRPPLTLTSDKSTECYRNWWPGPGSAMVDLMNRSIDLLETWADESDNVFHLSRRGYLYVTADPHRLADMQREAREINALGAGELRVHRGTAEDPVYQEAAPDGYRNAARGADLFTDGDSLRRQFPYISTNAVGGLHARRAGWFSAQQLGAWLLDRARSAGAELVVDSVVEVDTAGGRVGSVRLASGASIKTPHFVNAAGPLVGEVGTLTGVDLPVFSEVHRKISFADSRSAVPRTAPMLIWNDPQMIDWTDEERAGLLADSALAHLVERLGAGAHCRPEGSKDAATVLGLWEYRTDVRAPTFPIPEDPLYPEIVMRGLATMVPPLGEYLERLPRPFIDGGYYTKTRENRPLIGPAGPEGSVVVGALSGFGVMAAAAAGELGAIHVTGGSLPDYARWFEPGRYEDPEYLALLGQMTDSGQI
ncbi:MAG: FAD-binding oxidoreductase [Acidimicrobiia bacterium]|nr:FAD-binding oxidoreductase [Acidimicrobiia bacterium]